MFAFTQRKIGEFSSEVSHATLFHNWIRNLRSATMVMGSAQRARRALSHFRGYCLQSPHFKHKSTQLSYPKGSSNKLQDDTTSPSFEVICIENRQVHLFSICLGWELTIKVSIKSAVPQQITQQSFTAAIYSTIEVKILSKTVITFLVFNAWIIKIKYCQWFYISRDIRE